MGQSRIEKYSGLFATVYSDNNTIEDSFTLHFSINTALMKTALTQNK